MLASRSSSWTTRPSPRPSATRNRRATGGTCWDVDARGRDGGRHGDGGLCHLIVVISQTAPTTSAVIRRATRVVSNNLSTPRSPPTASEKSGFPTPTAVAPCVWNNVIKANRHETPRRTSARALTTSVPRRTPESRSTGVPRPRRPPGARPAHQALRRAGGRRACSHRRRRRRVHGERSVLAGHMPLTTSGIDGSRRSSSGAKIRSPRRPPVSNRASEFWSQARCSRASQAAAAGGVAT